MKIMVSCPKNHVPTYNEPGIKFLGDPNEVAKRIATHVAMPCPQCGQAEVSIEDEGIIVGKALKWEK